MRKKGTTHSSVCYEARHCGYHNPLGSSSHSGPEFIHAVEHFSLALILAEQHAQTHTHTHILTHTESQTCLCIGVCTGSCFTRRKYVTSLKTEKIRAVLGDLGIVRMLMFNKWFVF